MIFFFICVFTRYFVLKQYLNWLSFANLTLKLYIYTRFMCAILIAWLLREVRILGLQAK